jgi:hypothetical protein
LLFYTHYPLSTLCRISDQYGWPLLKELDTVLFVCVQRSFPPIKGLACSLCSAMCVLGSDS